MVIFEPELNRGLIEGLTSKTLHKLGYDASQTLDPKIAAVLDEALLVAKKVARRQKTDGSHKGSITHGRPYQPDVKLRATCFPHTRA